MNATELAAASPATRSSTYTAPSCAAAMRGLGSAAQGGSAARGVCASTGRFLDNGRWAGNLNTMRTVADAMTKPVIVEPSATIQHAAATMLDGRSEAAIVVEGGKVCGLVSADDVARALAESLDPTETPVGAIAATDPPLARSDEALADVHQRMRAEQHPLAVVIGPDGQPLGLLADPEAGP